MGDTRNACRILDGKPKRRDLFGEPGVKRILSRIGLIRLRIGFSGGLL
jgi:hypothetical protein